LDRGVVIGKRENLDLTDIAHLELLNFVIGYHSSNATQKLQTIAVSNAAEKLPRALIETKCFLCQNQTI
jgi:predicted acetyltransferase